MVRPRKAPVGKNGAPDAQNQNEIVVISGWGSLRLSEDGSGVAGPRIGDSPVMRRSSPNNFHFVRWDFPESSRSLARSLGGQQPLRAAAWLLVSQLRDATCKTCWSEFLVFRNLTFFLARSESVRRLDISVFSRESGRPDRKPSEIPIMRPLIIPIMVEVCSSNFYFSVLDISVFVGKAGGRIESQTKSR